VGVPGSAPAALSLAGPRPNPSRGELDLSFVLSRPGNAELTIFDLAGRLVRELTRGPSPAGPQRVHWDGRDDAGRIVGAGVYFVKLEAEGFALRRRLVLVR